MGSDFMKRILYVCPDIPIGLRDCGALLVYGIEECREILRQGSDGNRGIFYSYAWTMATSHWRIM